MGNRMSLRTRAEVLAAIDICRNVYVQPRFGYGEAWVAITKKEAREFIGRLGPNDTPQGFEMYADYFAQLHNKVLYIG